MKSKLVFECLWILFTLLLCALVLLPIFNNLGERYPFYTENIVFVIASVTFMRYIFLLKFHWIANTTYPKVALIFLSIPIMMYLVDNVYDFQAYVDEEGLYSLLEKFPVEKQKSLGSYMKTQMIFFWTAAVISAILLPIRMIVSLWRQRNRGTV